LGSIDALDGDCTRETIKYHKAKKKIKGLHEGMLYGRAAHITPLRQFDAVEAGRLQTRIIYH
jgi:hypothetical protein